MMFAKILSQQKKDFVATIECEHCGSKAVLTTARNDGAYYKHVMAETYCQTCGKNRAGETRDAS